MAEFSVKFCPSQRGAMSRQSFTAGALRNPIVEQLTENSELLIRRAYLQFVGERQCLASVEPGQLGSQSVEFGKGACALGAEEFERSTGAAAAELGRELQILCRWRFLSHDLPENLYDLVSLERIERHAHAA